MLSPPYKKTLLLAITLLSAQIGSAQDSTWVFDPPPKYDQWDFAYYAMPATSAVRLPNCFFQEEVIYSRRYNLYPGKSSLYRNDISADKPRKYIVARKNGKYGVILEDTTVIVEPIYEAINKFRQSFGYFFTAKKDGLWGAINYKNEIVIPFEHERIRGNNHSSYESCGHLRNLIEVWKDTKMGLYTKSGRPVIPCKYDQIDYAGNDLSCPLTTSHFQVSLDGKYGYVSNTGEELIPPIYTKIEEIGTYKRNKHLVFFKVYLGDKVGILDVKGKEMIPARYNSLDHIVTDIGLYYVYKEDGKYGCLDQNGEVLLSPQYLKCNIREGFEGDVAARFSESTDGDHYPAKMSYVQLLENGSFIYRLHGKWGLYSIESDSLYPAEYSRIHPSWGRYLFPEKNGKFGFMYSDGEELSPPIYDEKLDIWELVNEGIVRCKRNGKYGVINEEGEEIIEPKYRTKFSLPFGYSRSDDCFTSFNEGNYLVVISREGTELIYSDTIQDVACDKASKHIIATSNGQKYLLSPEGLLKTSVGYESIISSKAVSYGEVPLCFRVQKDGKRGMLDSNGVEVIPCKYDGLYELSYGNYYMQKDSMLYTYSLEHGNSNIEFKGTSLNYFDGLSAIKYMEGSYYLLDTSNRIVSKAYSELKPAGPGYFRCNTPTKGYNFINRAGEEQLELYYPKVKYYDGKVGIVKHNGLYGIIDSNENFTLQPTYEKVKGVYDGKICVRKNKKFGVIDFEGNILMDFVFEVPVDIETIAKKGIANQWSGNYNYDIDQNFNILNPWRTRRDKELFPWDHDYSPIRKLSHADSDYFIVKREGNFGLADTTGKLIIPVKYDEIITELSFYNFGIGEEGISDLVVVREDTLCAVYNMKTADISEFVYSGWRSLFPGELQVLKANSWVILSPEGKEEEVLDF